MCLEMLNAHPTCGALSLTDSGALLLIHSVALNLIHSGAVLRHHWLALLPVDDGALLGVHQSTFVTTLWLIETSLRKESLALVTPLPWPTCCPPCPQEQPSPADSPELFVHQYFHCQEE